MDKITVTKFTDLDGTEHEQVMIDHGDGEFSSMTKETYDARQREIKTSK